MLYKIFTQKKKQCEEKKLTFHLCCASVKLGDYTQGRPNIYSERSHSIRQTRHCTLRSKGPDLRADIDQKEKMQRLIREVHSLHTEVPIDPAFN